MLQKYFDGAVPSRGELTPSDEAIDALAVSVTERADAAVEGFAPHEAIAAVWELVDALNGYTSPSRSRGRWRRTRRSASASAPSSRPRCVASAP